METNSLIDFYYGNSFPFFFNKEKIIDWILLVIRREEARPGIIQFIFYDDQKLLDLNKRYLNHNTLTDVITFNYNDDFDGISGDIFISYERVIENAERYKVTPEKELRRVMVHGVLHLLGYDDTDVGARMLMQSKENYYLSLCDF